MLKPASIISHRTTAGHAPENTLAGLLAARDIGCEWVELDAKLTGDGIVILMHDETLQRTTNGSGAIAATDFSTIETLDAGRWFAPTFSGERVPTLAAALLQSNALGLSINLEIKPCPGRVADTAHAVCDVMAGLPALPPLILSCFDAEALAISRSRFADIPRALLVNHVDPAVLDWACDLGCEGIHCRDNAVTHDGIRAVHRVQMAYRSFVVNDPERAAVLFSWGVDGLFSDWPEML